MENNNKKDPSYNVRELIEAEVKRVDDKFVDVKEFYNMKSDGIVLAANQRFDAQQLALKDALMAQEKQTALALTNTEKAIDKADINTDKRFTQLSDKISEAVDSINKSTGAQGIYVTHTDLNIFGEKLQSGFEDALKPLVTQVNILTAAQNSQTGKEKGAGTSWQTMVTIISVCGTLIAIFFALSK